MTWQKIIDHINGHRIRVESKSGKQYPVETPREMDNDLVYRHMMNPKNDWQLWADVEFPDDGSPTTDRIQTGHPSGGPPRE